jgi:hypothetical protein
VEYDDLTLPSDGFCGWGRDIFRVPLSTLQRRRDDGEWDLVNIRAKSRSLFIHRIGAQGQHAGTLTAAWLMKWDIQPGISNPPPYPGMISAAIGYLREYIADSAYIQRRSTNEPQKVYKARIYSTLRTMDESNVINQEMRITKLWPQVNWGMIWENLRLAAVHGSDIATWYQVTHDIIPTNTRLHRIYMSSTDTCTECGNRDTLVYRLTECGEGAQLGTR